jgi:CBS domain-containing protein
MSAGTICTRVVATASPSETVRTAARRMAENDVGTLVVMGPNGSPAGLVTDRDLTIRCLAPGLDPDQTQLAQVMTTPVQSIDEHTPIEQAISRMASAGIRRLVVTGPARGLVGLLSLDDVLDLLVEETAAVGRLLEKQAPRIAV